MDANLLQCHLDVQEDQLKDGMSLDDKNFGEDPQSHWGVLFSLTLFVLMILADYMSSKVRSRL